MSTKGQVIVPQGIRNRRQWGPGTRLIVEDTKDGVLLKTAPVFAPTRPEHVFGCARSQARPLTLAAMDAAVLREAKRRRARDRY
jgi:AbrB family looped-hinge helix DNA binding protein